MGKIEQSIVDYLEQYGQPQTVQAIDDHLASLGYEGYDWYTIEAVAEAGDIKHADGGVDFRGEPVKLYAPNSFKG